MLETLTILPMAPGTRSRRPDVLHRATPVLLPKPKQRQTTLDQHLHSVAVRQANAQTRPPPPPQAPQQASQQRAPRQPKPLQPQQQQPQNQQQNQQHHQRQQQSEQHQQQLSFTIAAPTRSIQNILNHANSMGSMSAARPKRKIASDADAKPETNGHASGSGSSSGISNNSGSTDANTNDNTLESALRKRPRLAVEIIDYAKSPGLASPPVPQAALPPPRPGMATKTKTSSLAAIPIAPSPSTTTHMPALLPSTTTTSTTATSSRPISTRQHILPSTYRPPALERTTRDKAATTSTNSVPAAASSHVPPPSFDAARPHRPPGRPPSKTASQLATRPPKEKAANGFKQELKGLQVSTAEAVAVAREPREGGRKLRSQEATRFKSDLSAYFPDYDEVIGNEPKEEHILNMDTPILFVESSAAYPATTLPPTSTISSAPLVASLRSSDRAGPVRVKGYGDKLFYDVFDSHVLDFTFLGNQHKGKGAVDPLPDSYFEIHHKRAERLERSIRNTEKGRAQHEKDQIIRLLEGLQGPDWLRTMGVSGITESKKKTFEPAREHFVRGCRAILEKFRLWSLEEKRRKLEKDRAHAEEVKAREAAAEAGAAHPSRGKGRAKADSTAPKPRKRRDVAGKTTGKGANEKDDDDAVEEPDEEEDDDKGGEDEDVVADEDDIDDDSQPDSSDFDAVIAQQLREEALARSRLASKAAASTNKRRKPNRATKQDSARLKEASPSPPPPPASAALPPSPSQPQEEVKSFFRKRYQRDAALSRGRRKGRTVMAWGQPVPEPPETEFHLPSEILNKGASRGAASGRGKRGSARDDARGGGRSGARGAAHT